MRVAVAGNPNAGKTTLFNQLTGSRAHVANYPGVTVERRVAEARLPGGERALFIDLPGCYSLVARSPEEEVAHQALLGRLGDERPELVVCVVDATCLSRGLYLALQLIEMELPVVIALNMVDAAATQGLRIDSHALSRALGVPVIETVARDGRGKHELVAALRAELANGSSSSAGKTPVLSLSPTDQATVTALRETLLRRGLPASLGEALWLLSSSDTALARTCSAEIRQDVAAARRQSEREAPGSLARRIITARYARIDELLVGVYDASSRRDDVLTERLDRVLLHPVLGLTTFAVAMMVLFQAVFSWAEPMIGGVESLMGWLGDGVTALLPDSLFRSLLVNGVLAGVGNVLVFLPQIALLFLGIAILEESGYLARAAFLLDRLMRRVGLHGKAFIPLMSSFACAVPGVMSARTVESHRDRLVTILVAPFMSCSARLPVYVLVIAAVFSAAPPLFGVLSMGGVIVAAMYGLGFAAALTLAWLLKRTVLRAPPPPFLLELPSYRWPRWRDVGKTVWQRCRVFIIQTGTVILALSMLLWAMLTFPRQGLPEAEVAERRAALSAQVRAGTLDAAGVSAAEESLERDDQRARLENSIGGRLGHLVEPLIEPLGFDWRIGIGLIASFAAREVLVSTLGQVYALGADVEPDSPALRDALRADINPATGQPHFSPLVGLSLMVFFVLAMQCLSTVATVKRETNSWRWPIFQLVVMNIAAYVASLTVYQVGRALGFS